MLAIWENLLKEKGAVLSDGRVSHFGNPAAEVATAAEATILSDLSHLGMLRLEGEDARSFLQGQLTNDLHQVRPEQAIRAGYCSPKGRLLASFLVLEHEGGFELLLPASLLEAVKKRLSMFILRAKVQAIDVSDTSVRLLLQGDQAASVLTELGVTVPAAVMGVAQVNNVRVLRQTESGFVLIVAAEVAADLASNLARRVSWVGADAASLAEVRAGVPWILPETVEEFVPQMVNFEEIGAVSFKKGCYPGQEIVARSQYLGQTKRKMYHFASESVAVRPGDSVYAKGATNATGTVVNVAPSPRGGVEILAVVHRDTMAGSLPCLQDGSALMPLPLPYALAGSASE